MILYHFTSRHHVKGCFTEGIRLGVVPVNFGKLLPGYQWLTTSPEFGQSWNAMSSLPYDRCEFRLKIEVPKGLSRKVLVWLDVCKRLSDIHGDLNAFGDPENWRLFKGAIQPHWIKEIARKQ